MSDTTLILITIISIFSISGGFFYTLNQEFNDALRNLESDSIAYLEKFAHHSAKSVDYEIEKELTLNEEFKKTETLIQSIEKINDELLELSAKLYKKTLKSLPKKLNPEEEKYENEKILDLKKGGSFKVLSEKQDTLPNKIVDEVVKYEKYSKTMVALRNIVKNHKIWTFRYLLENNLETRFNNILKVNTENEFKTLKQGFSQKIVLFNDADVNKKCEKIDLKKLEERINKLEN